MPTEKQIEHRIDGQREKRGAASKALRIAKTIDAPKSAKDSLKELRIDLKDTREDAAKRLAELRAKREHLNKDGIEEAVRWACAQNGVMETPAGSNWGVPVENWIKRSGWSFAVAWCGSFVHEAVVEHGDAEIPQGVRLTYGPSIMADAKANANGLRGVPIGSARRGLIGVLWNGAHIVLLREGIHDGMIATVEGNTSATDSGSQDNGGCVALKRRYLADFSALAAWG